MIADSLHLLLPVWQHGSAWHEQEGKKERTPRSRSQRSRSFQRLPVQHRRTKAGKKRMVMIYDGLENIKSPE
ncbi:MAG: hypothetical protein C4530_22580 [Desulfobacteraceae bacterium]|nr:MAG: hypothetical protein C4530_22580 [Desulfobacteraceae bacterium]